MTQLTGKWILYEAAGTPVPKHPELKFGEDQVHYRYGNNFTIGYEVNGGSVKFGSAVSTRMLSPQDPPEQLVSEAITSADKWAIDGDTLTLSNNSGVRAVLRKA